MKLHTLGRSVVILAVATGCNETEETGVFTDADQAEIVSIADSAVQRFAGDSDWVELASSRSTPQVAAGVDLRIHEVSTGGLWNRGYRYGNYRVLVLGGNCPVRS